MPQNPFAEPILFMLMFAIHLLMEVHDDDDNDDNDDNECDTAAALDLGEARSESNPYFLVFCLFIFLPFMP
jgi:hypothetical protein